MKTPSQNDVNIKPTDLGKEIASRDATFFISMLNSLPNPDPILKKTGQRIQVYRDLSADWEVFSATELIHAGLKDLMWEIDPNDADPAAVELITELVESWDVYNIMTQCVDGRNFGYQPFELVWQVVEKKWLITELISKPPEWFNYSPKNELQFISKTNPKGEPVPAGKFIVARNRPSYHNPYGESHYSRCFWPVTFKRGGVTFLVKFLEKYGMPWLVGKQPRNTGTKETNKLLASLHDMVQDAVAVIPDDSSIELQDAASRTSSSDAFLTFMHYCDEAINKVILSNELSTSVSKTGADVRGDGASQMEVSNKVIRSVAQMAETVINNAIKLMWPLNFTGKIPKAKIYEPKSVQKERATRDKILTDTGIRFTREYFMQNYALAENDFDMVEIKPDKETPPAEPTLTEKEKEFFEQLLTPIRIFNEKMDQAITPPAEPVNFKEQQKKTFLPEWMEWFKKLLGAKKEEFAEDAILENSNNAQQFIDELIEIAGGKEGAEISQAHLQEVLQPLLDLVNSTDSYQVVMQKLAGLYPYMNSEELEERLARAYFIADTIGRITEQENAEMD